MKRSTKSRVLLALAVIWSVNSTPVLAVGINKTAAAALPAPAQPLRSRVIVKLKAGKVVQTVQAMSVSQIRAELSKPLSVEVIQQLQTAAGVPMSDLRATGNGAHVMSLGGVRDRQAMAQAIAKIGALPNVEYVEEDRIETIQAVPNDTYYTTYTPAAKIGLWGMQPVTTDVTPAPGATGSYGADFETAWNTVTGTGVVVAVIDSGITAHPDIVGAGGTISPATGNLASPGYTFITDCRIKGTCAADTVDASAIVAPVAGAADSGDFITLLECQTASSYFYDPTCTAATNSSWHGTHVAGTIAAIGNNTTGVIGGAHGAKILPVRALGKGGGYASDISDAILWAAGVHPTISNPNPAKVINMSLGSTGACSATRQAAINAAVAAGSTVVVAAGNAGVDVADTNSANCKNVISVAAIARDGSRASYSNFSSPTSNTTNPVSVTLAAQGGDQFYDTAPNYFDPGILSTVDTGTTAPAGPGYAYLQGTSMATPHVSAAVALMLSRNSALTPAQVKAILSSPASLTPFPTFSGTGMTAWDCALQKNCGAGILNARLAVQNSMQSLAVSAGSGDFGTRITSATGYDSMLTLTASAGVTTTTATITGPDAGKFSVASTTCNNAILATNNTCQITVHYDSSTAGTHTATLTVPTATGVAAIIGLAGASGPALTASATLKTAATVNVGSSTSVAFSFTNPNSVSETLGTLSLSNPTIMLATADNCSGQTLAAGASCSVTVTITPTAVGSYSGTASLGLSTTSTSAVVTIQGTANAAPAPAASSGGGGGGCAIMPLGADPDVSLLLAMLAVGVYWLRRRAARGGSAA